MSEATQLEQVVEQAWERGLVCFLLCVPGTGWGTGESFKPAPLWIP